MCIRDRPDVGRLRDTRPPSRHPVRKPTLSVDVCMISTRVRLGEIVRAKVRAGATRVVAAPPLRSFLSPVGVVPPTILTSVGPVLDPAVPDVAVPDVAVPDVAVPDVAVPEVAVPDVAVPDVAVPDVAVPDVTVPDVAVPE